MKKKIILFMLCLALILNGCRAVSPNSPGSQSAKEENGYEGAYGSADYAASSYDDISAGDRGDETEIGAEDPGSGSTEEVSQADAQTAAPEPETGVTDNQKLVYTCDMEMETLEYETTIKSIKETITKYSGITEREDQTDTDSYWYNENSKHQGTMRCYLVIRIPSANYQAFLEELSGNGKIISKNMKVDNITKRYTEVQTTIKSLQIQEKRLLDMMEKATSVNDMITVESRLTEVQNELAQYKNSLAGMDTDVKYSTINLTVNEVVKYEAKQETFMERLNSTLDRSGELFLSFLESALFAVILFGPIILVLLIVLFIIVRIIRRLRRNKKQKNSKKRVLNQEEAKPSPPVVSQPETEKEVEEEAADSQE